MDIRQQSILSYSSQILDYLLKFKESHLDFTFSLRKRDSVQSDIKRLEKGQWFQGSDYIYVPLFKKGDSARKVKTFGFVLDFNRAGKIKHSTITISCKGGITDKNEIAFHKELASALGIELNENNCGDYVFENPNDVFVNLEYFITEVRDKAVKLLRKYGLEPTYAVKDAEFQTDLAKIKDIKTSLQGNVNYWVFQGNPKVYNTIEALRENAIKTWTVSTHRDKIKEGDKFILWLTGDQSGCYALGKVLSGVAEMKENDGEMSYYLEPTDQLVRHRVRVEIEYNFADNPVLGRDIKNNPVFDSFKAGNQGTNFTATAEEYQTLLQLGTNDNYFKLDEIEEYRNVSETPYNASKKEAKWYYDTREKLYYFIRTILSKAVGEELKLVYTEQPNAQKGRGKILFKDYVLAGFAPIPNRGDDLFIKVSLTNLKRSPLFAIDLDLNFRKATSKFTKTRNQIYNDSLVEYPIDKNFPRNFQALLQLVLPEIKAKLEQFKRMTMANSENQRNTTNARQPLNQILYGPPGTGKTYETKLLAVKIANPDFSIDESLDSEERRKAVVDEYNFLYESGQIVFTTFHQSMSYEDFVEGIKPETKDGKISYDVKEGIFKSLCAIAEDNWTDVSKGNRAELSFEEAFTRLKEEWEEDESIIFPMVREGNGYTVIGFSKSSIQFKKASGGTGHTLSIATLRDYYYGKREVRKTGVGIYYPPMLKKLKEYKPVSAADKELKLYVLIIDEINRGNVSGIFGELITLLEKDKRLGEIEELRVTLPYSKDIADFGVPPNLYIIGTMNTADRSVEALDTALRRRFSFTEMMPKYEELEKINFDGFNLGVLLRLINRRIEILLDRDHAIGHSYFINIKRGDIKSLKDAFLNCIIPLLQEYFYHDYEKIAMILGNGFVDTNEPKDNEVTFAIRPSNPPDIVTTYSLKRNISNIEEAIKEMLQPTWTNSVQ
ncbi:MAG: EVE domain-containing protein [Flavobacterium sp.]|nr:MAG: EVE domain-containing protein [Flavobacterium sp.]